MVWKLNEPWNVSGTAFSTTITPVFDGKNVWAVDGTDVKCIEFWGPYNDLDNYSNRRWTEDYYWDAYASGTLGPKLRVIKSIPSGISPIGMCYYDNRIYVWDGTTVKSWHVSASTSGEVSTLGTTTAGNSDLIASNGRLYYVGLHPTSQTLDDQQRLYWMSTTTGVETAGGLIPGRKQQAKRYFTIANDTVYVSAYNERSVHKFNAVSGAYLTSIVVNRDVERIYSVDNDVYVISSLRGKTTVGDTQYSNSMVSQISTSDVVTHRFGIIGGGTALAWEGDYIWFITDSGGLQRTKVSDNSTFLTAGTGISGDDFTIASLVANNILITPSLTYQAADITGALGTSTLAKHLFLVTSNSITAIRLGSPLYWDNSFEMNQYTAVSSGGLSYKED